MSVLLACAVLAGCADAPEPAGGAPASAPTSPTASASPSATPSPSAAACGEGRSAGASRAEFVTPYIEQERAYDGAIAGEWLRKEHAFRSWTDMRIVAHRDMAWTGEEGFEVVTVDATNGTTTWLLTLRYELRAGCVDDRSADDARVCAHWGTAANATRAAFEAAGGWSSFAGSDCRTSGGG